MFDGKAFGQEVVGAVKAHMEKTLAPIVARMDALEQRLADMPTPKDGKDADPEEVADIVSNRLAAEIDEVRATVEGVKAPELPDIPAMIAEAVAAIPSPQDGRSPSPEELAPLVDESVSRALAGLPVPKDGKDGADGRDGCDVVDAMLDREGNLVVTFSDGRMKNVGPVCGKDGAPGRDGADGFGFDDLDLVETEAGLMLRFTRGDVVKEFRLPVVLDRGVFKEGATYKAGDGVSYGGSFWIAQDETSEKPENGAKGWRLAIKRGRDGKDGKDGGPPVPKTPIKVG